MNFRRVFIANRGEIAVRIIRTCRRLGIETVLGASEADLDSVPARLADKTVCIGSPQAAESYLRTDKIVRAAEQAGVDAIHPGYGFLAENAAFADAAGQAGLTFIGPTQTQLDSLGDKLRARALAVEAGLPVVPGGPVESAGAADVLARGIGFPVLVKAVGGGGGRGMKLVREPGQLMQTAALAAAEAQAAFGNAQIYLERYVEHGRHVEVQILSDGEHVIHVGDRDCSIQRRYQKLLEEAPAPALPDDLRADMRAAAVALAAHLGYCGLGTVEFLVDGARNAFYFLEMNARIQVEHPVTEAITGLDLVAEQIAVAEGRPLGLRQEDVRFTGHAFECRINAEDCADDFRPCPGTVRIAVFPAGPGVRVDTHIEEGVNVPPYYDSLLAKIIVHGADRPTALAAMRTALANCRIEGVETNIALHTALCEDATFKAGGVDTGFLPRILESGSWKR